jgi:hypothetical protein
MVTWSNSQWSNGQWSMVNGQWSMVNGQWNRLNCEFLILLLNKTGYLLNVDSLLGFLFFIEAKNSNRAITITANPGFQFIIIFKDIHTYRVALAGQGNDFGKISLIYFKHFYRITAVAGSE